MPETLLIGVGASHRNLFPTIDFLSQIYEEIPQAAFILNVYDNVEKIPADIVKVVNRSTYLRLAFPEGMFIPQPRYIYFIPSNFCCTVHEEYAEAHPRKSGFEANPVELFFKSYIKVKKIDATNLLFIGLHANEMSNLRVLLGKQSFSAFEVPVSQKGGEDKTWFEVHSRMKSGLEGYESMKNHLVRFIKHTSPLFYKTSYSAHKEANRMEVRTQGKKEEIDKNRYEALLKENEQLKRNEKKLQAQLEEGRHLAESLTLEQKKITALLASSQEGILVFDQSATLLTFNKMAADILLQLTGSHLQTGKSMFGLVNAKTGNPGNNLNDALEGKKVQGETHEKNKKGHDLWLRYLYYPLQVSEGQRLIALSLQDITREKLQEAGELHSAEWFKAVFDASRDGLVAEYEGKIYHCNLSLLQMFGYGAAIELIGNEVEVLLSKEGKELASTYGKRRIEGEPVPEMYETTGLKADGSIFHIELSATAIKMGEKHFIVTSIRDITKRKKAQKKLLKKNVELTKMNTELDRFVYSASHDLRAPLNSILGIIQIARLEKAADVPEQYLHMIEDNIRKLKEFLSDITDYSRNTRLKVKPEAVNLKELINDIYQGLKFSNKKAQNFQFHLEIEENVTPFISDRSRLTMIFNNLLSNAIRYANLNNSEPFIKVSVRFADQVAHIVVSDNGEGIAEEHQEKIFEMFYRASESQKGSGLGLYIVKEAVEKLGGTISLKSEVKVGATFKLSIPPFQEEELN